MAKVLTIYLEGGSQILTSEEGLFEKLQEEMVKEEAPFLIVTSRSGEKEFFRADRIIRLSLRDAIG